MNKTKTYYQPYLKFAGEEELYFPEEALCSFHAFISKDDAEQFIAEYTDYSNYELVIKEYHDEDIEGVTILDGDGNIIEINED